MFEYEVGGACWAKDNARVNSSRKFKCHLIFLAPLIYFQIVRLSRKLASNVDFWLVTSTWSFEFLGVTPDLIITAD